MAFGRSVASFSAVMSGLRRLAVAESSAAATGCAQQHLAAPTLASLRSFVPAMACWSGPSSLTAQLGLAAAGHRHFAAAAAAARAGPAQQQAAATAGEAEQQQGGGAAEEEETLEQIRSRIFGTHIGRRWSLALVCVCVMCVCSTQRTLLTPRLLPPPPRLLQAMGCARGAKSCDGR